MKDEILSYLDPREEKLTLNGRVVIVRELASAADTTAMQDNVDMAWKLLVRCVLDEAGSQIFGDEDIARLKRTGKLKMKLLVDAVMRVNGYDVEGDEKKSGAGPRAG